MFEEHLALIDATAGLQIAAFSADGTELVSFAGGIDLHGEPFTDTTSSQLYCLTKPLLAAALAQEPAANSILNQPIADTWPAADPSLARVMGWELLDHHACLADLPVSVAISLPPEVRTQALTGIRSDPKLRAQGHQAYSDIACWLLTDIILRSANPESGVLEVATAGFADSGLTFVTEPGASLTHVAVDGVVGPPRRLVFSCLSQPEYVADRSILLSSVGTASDVAAAYVQIGHLLDTDLGERLTGQPYPGEPPEPLSGLFNGFGAGTMVRWKGSSVALVGHLAWGGAGAAWWDADRRVACCIRCLGLDLSGTYAFDYRLRPLVKELERVLDAA